jgi:hypothetical protein
MHKKLQQENLKERHHSEDVGIDGRIILQEVFFFIRRDHVENDAYNSRIAVCVFVAAGSCLLRSCLAAERHTGLHCFGL